MLIMHRKDDFKKVIPTFSLAALQSKNCLLSLPFNAALYEKSEAEKEGGHHQAKLPSSCLEQSRKLTEGTRGLDGLRATGKV